MTIHAVLEEHGAASVCHLQTAGRVTGGPRTIEIWFATDGERVYLLAGGRERAHWVRNVRADPHVRVRIGGRTVEGLAHVIEDAERALLARHLVAAKYQGWTPGSALSSWAAESLPVEISLTG